MVNEESVFETLVLVYVKIKPDTSIYMCVCVSPDKRG